MSAVWFITSTFWQLQRADIMIDFPKQCHHHLPFFIHCIISQKTNYSWVFVWDTGSTSLICLFKKQKKTNRGQKRTNCVSNLKLLLRFFFYSSCSESIGMHRGFLALEKYCKRGEWAGAISSVPLCFYSVWIDSTQSKAIWREIGLTDERRYQCNHSSCYPPRLV